MSKRIKISGPLLRTRQDMETCVGNIRALTIEMNSLKAERDAALKAVDDRYQDRLQELGDSIGTACEDAEAWAVFNPGEFGKARSIQMVHGLVGFRIGQPALKTLPGWTFDRVLERLKNCALSQFIRTKEEVDKQTIIAMPADLDDKALRDIGVRIVQDDAFFIEPNLSETPVASVAA